jgi:hypothetical protein
MTTCSTTLVTSFLTQKSDFHFIISTSLYFSKKLNNIFSTPTVQISIYHDLAQNKFIIWLQAEIILKSVEEAFLPCPHQRKIAVVPFCALYLVPTSKQTPSHGEDLERTITIAMRHLHGGMVYDALRT